MLSSHSSMEASCTMPSPCCSKSCDQPLASTLGPEDMPCPWLRALMRECLSPSERLCLFRVNKGSAAAVLQQADACTLTLQYNPSDKEAAGRETDGLESRSTAIQSLLAAASNVALKVVLHGGWDHDFPLPSPLWPSVSLYHITSLTFYRLKLTQDSLYSLQLQQCSRLQHLKVDGCNMQMSVEDARRMSQQWKTWLPLSLTSLHVWTCSASLVPMPWLTPNISMFHTSYLTDNLLLDLQALPHLRKVKADSNYLAQDHRKLNLGWEQLELRGLCNTSKDLSLLPLHNIQHLWLYDVPRCYDYGLQARAHLASCPDLQVVPKDNLSCLNVPCHNTDTDTPVELALLCLYRSAVKPCGLYMMNFELRVSYFREYMLVCLLQLPVHTTAVCLELMSVVAGEEGYNLQQCIQLWEPLVAALPAHVTHVVMHMESNRPSVLTACGLLQALRGCKANATLQVFLVCPGPQTTGIEVQERLQQLTAAHPGRAVLCSTD